MGVPPDRWSVETFIAVHGSQVADQLGPMVRRAVCAA